MINEMPVQTRENHARMVPGFHYFGGLLVMGNLVWSLVRLVRVTTPDNGMHVLVAVILVVLYWYLRTFPLTVQDRVIRLEERLRLARLMPAEMHPKIDELTHRQLVALRFASDAEAPALARRIMDENIQDAKAIKGHIREWRADHLRA